MLSFSLLYRNYKAFFSLWHSQLPQPLGTMFHFISRRHTDQLWVNKCSLCTGSACTELNAFDRNALTDGISLNPPIMAGCLTINSGGEVCIALDVALGAR